MRDYDYDLPPAAIAQTPVEPRDAARLLVARTAGAPASVAHHAVADLPDLLDPGDVLVVNETRVLPARLRFRRPTGGAVEVLLLERRPEHDGRWEALVKPSRKLAPGTLVDAGDGLKVEFGEVVDAAAGTRLVRLHSDTTEDDALARHGVVPLPPYVTAPLADPERYQTVYAATPGSTAAPTAGLHLTPAVLDRCRARGVDVVTVDLVVGLDTFRPVTAERAEDHVMHTERYRVPAATLDRCAHAAGRTVAVGTTTVRALESAASTGALEGRTDLFIHGDFPFRVVDTLMTNFHLPRSSLLLLLDAFTGGGNGAWRDVYDLALAAGYRFLSFGDAMLVDRGALATG